MRVATLPLMRRLLVLVPFVLLVGCGGSSRSTPKATPSPTPTKPAGSAAFIADARSLGLIAGSGTARAILTIGNQVCSDFGTGLPYGQVVSAYTQKGSPFTIDQVDRLVRSAVVNLCPEQKSKLP